MRVSITFAICLTCFPIQSVFGFLGPRFPANRRNLGDAKTSALRLTSDSNARAGDAPLLPNIAHGILTSRTYDRYCQISQVVGRIAEPPGASVLDISSVSVLSLFPNPISLVGRDGLPGSAPSKRPIGAGFLHLFKVG